MSRSLWHSRQRLAINGAMSRLKSGIETTLACAKTVQAKMVIIVCQEHLISFDLRAKIGFSSEHPKIDCQQNQHKKKNLAIYYLGFYLTVLAELMIFFLHSRKIIHII